MFCYLFIKYLNTLLCVGVFVNLSSIWEPSETYLFQCNVFFHVVTYYRENGYMPMIRHDAQCDNGCALSEYWYVGLWKQGLRKCIYDMILCFCSWTWTCWCAEHCCVGLVTMSLAHMEFIFLAKDNLQECLLYAGQGFPNGFVWLIYITLHIPIFSFFLTFFALVNHFCTMIYGACRATCHSFHSCLWYAKIRSTVNLGLWR